jgi:uncharacterized membrane protein
VRRRKLALWALSLCCLPLPLSACGDETTAAEASACGPDTPAETWASFGEAFVTTHCQGCHASGALDRAGAPEEVVFDTAEQTHAWRERILARSGPESPTMPPQGGPSAEDRERLRIWLTCFDGL